MGGINFGLTFVVESEAHVHEGFGGAEVVRVGALEQNYGEILRQTEEGGFRHTFVLRSLSIDEPSKPQPSSLILQMIPLIFFF